MFLNQNIILKLKEMVHKLIIWELIIFKILMEQWYLNPRNKFEKLKETYIRRFNTEPSKGLKTPLDKNDHPELDTSEILEGQEVNHYLTMVGQLQWLITLGRFDIQAQVITMSRFRAQPRKGHLDRLKRI